MDSMVQSLLDSKNEPERARLFDEIIRMQTAPLTRKILRQRLGFYIDLDGHSPNNPEAEDLYNKILLSLEQRLRDLLAEPEQHPIDDYRQYVISVATGDCQNFLRAKSNPRARLKNNLRGMIRRHSEFKLWEDHNGRSLCGFAAWEGRRISIASSERMAWLKENPESFKSTRFTYKSLQKAPYPKLVAEIFHWLEDPIGFEDLVELVPLFRQIKEQPAEPIEPAEKHQEPPLAAAAPTAGDGLEKEKMLKQLWEEVKRLPPESGLILCLSPIGEECEDLWDLLLTTNVISLPELADGLEIPLEQITKIRMQAPMDSKTLADYLGATTSQVNQWRFQAAKHLQERFSLSPADWFRHEHLDYDQLESFAENRLGAEETAIVNLHLETCAVCRGDVHSFIEFRDATENEIHPRRTPAPRNPASKKLSSGENPSANRWKPAYTVAALLIIGSAILAAILFSRQGATGRQSQIPGPPQATSTVSGPLPAASSPSVSVTPNPTDSGEDTITSLVDGERIIRFNESGIVSGLETFPAEIRQNITEALLTGTPKRSIDLSELVSGPEKGSSAALLYPRRIVLTEDRPTFRWAPIAGASSYQVRVSHPNGNRIASSGELSSDTTQWKPSTRLKRGVILSWGVIAMVNGEEVTSEIGFKVLGGEKLGELAMLKNRYRSHLALGLYYIREGVLVEARREFELLVRDNPSTPIAAKLLRQAHSWR